MGSLNIGVAELACIIDGFNQTFGKVTFDNRRLIKEKEKLAAENSNLKNLKSILEDTIRSRDTELVNYSSESKRMKKDISYLEGEHKKLDEASYVASTNLRNLKAQFDLERNTTQCLTSEKEEVVKYFEAVSKELEDLKAKFAN